MDKHKLIGYLDGLIGTLREPYGTKEEYAAALKAAAMLDLVRSHALNGDFD